MLSGDLPRTAELALTEGEDGPARGRLRALPAGPADARVDGRDRRGRGRRLRARVGRVEARRDPHPGPPPRRRGAHLHAQPQRHHDALPGIVGRGRAAAGRQAVLDGEALWMDEDGPAAFQDTVSRIDSEAPPEGVVTFLFDVLHVDGEDLLDAPLARAPGAARDGRAAAEDPALHLRPGEGAARARRGARRRATRASS